MPGTGKFRHAQPEFFEPVLRLLEFRQYHKPETAGSDGLSRAFKTVKHWSGKPCGPFVRFQIEIKAATPWVAVFLYGNVLEIDFFQTIPAERLAVMICFLLPERQIFLRDEAGAGTNQPDLRRKIYHKIRRLRQKRIAVALRHDHDEIRVIFCYGIIVALECDRKQRNVSNVRAVQTQRREQKQPKQMFHRILSFGKG